MGQKITAIVEALNSAMSQGEQAVVQQLRDRLYTYRTIVHTSEIKNALDRADAWLANLKDEDTLILQGHIRNDGQAVVFETTERTRGGQKKVHVDPTKNAGFKLGPAAVDNYKGKTILPDHPPQVAAPAPVAEAATPEPTLAPEKEKKVIKIPPAAKWALLAFATLTGVGIIGIALYMFLWDALKVLLGMFVGILFLFAILGLVSAGKINGVLWVMKQDKQVIKQILEENSK